MFKKLKEKILNVTEKETVEEVKKPVAKVAKEKAEKEPKEKAPKKAKVTESIMDAAKKDTVMGKLMASIDTPPALGDMVEGPVIAIERGRVFIDLKPYGTGIIYGREYIIARDIVRKINVGDKIAAKIVDVGNDEGYIELSLKEARQALIWSEAEEAIKNKATLELPITDANKGGLLIEWQGIVGFLPASQLKSEHYPRVADGDKDRILEELKKLVGKKLLVQIITALPKEGKLIFSEKGADGTSSKEKTVKDTEGFKVGDTVTGSVTGIVDFGVFVKISNELEGLVHISEIDWSLVEDPRMFFKVGDQVKVKVIDVKDGKVSLSVKALKDNPWTEAQKKYKKEQAVTGVIIKFNKHGALASIEEGVAGLVHVSDFGSMEKLKEHLELGKTYPFKITLFDAKDQKMALSFTGDRKK